MRRSILPVLILLLALLPAGCGGDAADPAPPAADASDAAASNVPDTDAPEDTPPESPVHDGEAPSTDAAPPEEADDPPPLHANELAKVDGILRAFDGEGQVMTLEAGPQELFGAWYYVLESGDAVVLPEPGQLLRDGELYHVQEDGTLLTDGTVGHLAFGPDGRYTSGSAELDEFVKTLLAQLAGAGDSEAVLRAAYEHFRDNYRYLSMEHQPAGSTEWAEEYALRFFQLGKGNCYCWAASFMYCARQLGYQAYVVAGWESNPSNEHAWIMIEWPDGEVYLFDPQLEYAYLYMYTGKPKIDMFKAVGNGDGYYNGFAYYFP